jgi:hypothetical protein
MHHTTALLLCLSVAQQAWALTPMPDPNLRAWVNNNFPGAIVGTSIDETHPDVQSATYIDISFQGNVTDLMGVEAFVNATGLNVSNNPITTWMGPASLQTLAATNCGITGTFTAPWMITSLLVSYNAITTLDLSNCQNIAYVTAHHNQITAVNWPSNPSLGIMDLSYNQLTSLGANVYLPSLQSLNIAHNQFTAVPYGWNSLTLLDASWNQITDVSQLHGSDYNFVTDLSHNQIQYVPDLGNAESVDISFNPLTQGIAETSYRLETLRVTDTQLSCLPYLHHPLVDLYCTNSLFSCLPNQPPDLVMSAVNFGFPPAVCTSSDPCYMPLPRLDLRVFLQGPYVEDSVMMRDDLRAQGLLPTTDPYPALGLSYSGAGWPDALDPAVFTTTGPDAIVDWVVVQLSVDGGVLNPGDAELYSRPALVQRDGDVVALDGSWPLVMNTPRGAYRTAVRHRNHLGAIVKFGNWFSSDTVHVDLTRYSATACFNEAMHGDSLLSDHRQLWSGDVTFNHQLKYVGAANDRDPILVAIGGVVPHNTVSGVYANEDVNMDGVIKYAGVRNDRDPILVNIGGSTPNAVRNQVGF